MKTSLGTRRAVGNTGSSARPVMFVRPPAQSPDPPAGIVRFLVVPDIHAAAAPPRGRGDGYADELRSLVSQACRVGRMFRPHAVIQTGDIFHRKDPAPADIILAMDLVQELGKVAPVLAVPGNHDMTGNNRDDVAAKRGIGVLVRGGLLRLVDRNPAFVDGDGGRAAVIGSCYTGSRQRARGGLFSSMKFLSGEAWAQTGAAPYVVALVHEDVRPGGSLRPGDGIDPVGTVLDLSGEARNCIFASLWINGHIHTISEYYQKVRLLQAGTLGRTSLHEKGVEPCAWAVTLSRGGAACKRVPLVTPGGAGFLEVDGAADLENDKRVAEFVSFVASAGAETHDPAELVRAFARGRDVPAAVVDVCLAAIAEASAR